MDAVKKKEDGRSLRRQLAANNEAKKTG